MAPMSVEPGRLVVVLVPEHREALYQLVAEIVAHLRSQLELASHKHTCERPATEAPEVDGSKRTEMDTSTPPKHTTKDPELIALYESALEEYDGWKEGIMSNLKQVLYGKDDARPLEEYQTLDNQITQLDEAVPSEVGNISSQGKESAMSSATQDWPKAVANHQAIYHPVATGLTALPVQDRREVLSALLLLLLSTGAYAAYSRTLMAYLASALELPQSVLNQEEKEIATTMIRLSNDAAKEAPQGDAMSTEEEVQEQKQQNRASRLWKVGLASVAGATVIGVTGGLAGPVVAGAVGGLMGSVGLGGLASFLGVFWTKGALVGTLFGAFGAGMTGGVVDKYAREVQDFKFLPVNKDEGQELNNDDTNVRRLRVTIGINGWLQSEDDVSESWSVLGDDTEAFALRYEMKSLVGLGQALQDMAFSDAQSATDMEALRRTVLATLKAALWPVHLLKAATGIDTPFDLAKSRSEKAGRVLADALMHKVQGERPITLVGYSLGARVIYFCLKTLAARRAFGLVETVVLIGAPMSARKRSWQTIRSVVAGNIFNVYSQDDYILALLNRSASAQDGIAGLQAVEGIEGLINIDLSAEVKEHLQYPKMMAPILKKCGFVDIVESVVEQPIPNDDELRFREQDANRSGRPEDLRAGVPSGEIPTSPVAVKPLSKKFHRHISFPSGISRTEEPPLVKKVQSASIPADSPGRRSSLRKRENRADVSSQEALHKEADQGRKPPESIQETSTP